MPSGTNCQKLRTKRWKRPATVCLVVTVRTTSGFFVFFDVKFNSSHNSSHSHPLHPTEREFRMWASTQNLSDRESTLFLYLAFREKRIHRNHVDQLARDSDGNPKFNGVDALITEIVKQLHFSDEADCNIGFGRKCLYFDEMTVYFSSFWVFFWSTWAIFKMFSCQ